MTAPDDEPGADGAPDATDASDVTDAADATEAPDATDASDATDAPSDTDALDGDSLDTTDATTSSDPARLVARARDAAANAVAPYSEYSVGAAVATPAGVYTGCNLEVANYSNSLHAEEVALASALADGVREFDAVAITTASRDGATPCGSCRQTLWEFCAPDLPVYCDAGEAHEAYTLAELLPAAFSLEKSDTA